MDFTCSNHRLLCYRLRLAGTASESPLTSFELCLTVPGALLQALLLVGDDVLDVLHRQVVTKGVKENVFQLLQGDSLHVKLQGDKQHLTFPQLAIDQVHLGGQGKSICFALWEAVETFTPTIHFHILPTRSVHRVLNKRVGFERASEAAFGSSLLLS